MNAKEPQHLPAIPAEKNKLGAALIYHFLMRRGVWNSFDGVYLHCEGRLPGPGDGPVIFYLNHPSWWDGHMCALLDRIVLRSAFDSYMMVEEPQLRRYRFFRWIGAFSVDRHNPRAAARSISYIAGLLRDNPRGICWIFPQGTITPNDHRPLVLYPGVAHIVKRIGAVTLCPVALRYELRREERPDAFIRVGPLHRASAPINVDALTAEIADRLTTAVDRLRDDLLAERLDGYARLARGRAGINRTFDQLIGRFINQSG